jgi:hypothetical protein
LAGVAGVFFGAAALVTAGAAFFGATGAAGFAGAFVAVFVTAFAAGFAAGLAAAGFAALVAGLATGFAGAAFAGAAFTGAFFAATFAAGFAGVLDAAALAGAAFFATGFAAGFVAVFVAGFAAARTAVFAGALVFTPAVAVLAFFTSPAPPFLAVPLAVAELRAIFAISFTSVAVAAGCYSPDALAQQPVFWDTVGWLTPVDTGLKSDPPPPIPSVPL